LLSILASNKIYMRRESYDIDYNITVSWNVTPFSLVVHYLLCLTVKTCCVLWLTNEAADSSETSVTTYQNTQYYITRTFSPTNSINTFVLYQVEWVILERTKLVLETCSLQHLFVLVYTEIYIPI